MRPIRTRRRPIKITFIYPAFERHAQTHPELLDSVPCHEYRGPPSLGIACVAAATPEGHEIEYIDDRVTPFDPNHETDLAALTVFTPAATRALEIARALRARGTKVVMGGIFPSVLPELALEHADAIVQGEGEEVWPTLLRHAEAGCLQPRYRSLAPIDVSTLRPPRLDLYFGAENTEHRPDDYPLQVSRGCPLSCAACVLPIVSGRQIRYYSDEYLRRTVERIVAADKRVFLCEDTSLLTSDGARQHFRRTLEMFRDVGLGGKPLGLSYLATSVTMLASLDLETFQEFEALGLRRFYVVAGYDPITRRAFGGGDDKALRVAEKAIDRCRAHGIDTQVSFLVGNPEDGEEVFDRILEFAHQAKLELAEFCIATPYPGTPTWTRYQAEGRIFDYEWKHYNDANVVFRPHRMSAERLRRGYLHLWKEFYRNKPEAFIARPRAQRTIQL